MSRYRQYIIERLHYRDSVSFLGIGGATVSVLARRLVDTIGYDFVVIMVGGNDISNGVTIHTLMQGYEFLHERLMARGVRAVAFASVWPRADSHFNRLADTLSESMFRRYGCPKLFGLVFWLWDRRQPMRTRDDRVHLTDHGYQRSVVYCFSICLWLIRNR